MPGISNRIVGFANFLQSTENSGRSLYSFCETGPRFKRLSQCKDIYQITPAILHVLYRLALIMISL
jgi:hypothetical protein